MIHMETNGSFIQYWRDWWRFITFIRRKYLITIITTEFFHELFFVLAVLEYDSNIAPVSKQYAMNAHMLNVTL
jgi:hypothetical protein